MTQKQLTFIQEYPKDWNATAAAIRAGCNPNSAGVTASKWLKNSKIRDAIAIKTAQISGEAGITIERIVMELAKIAFADYTQVFYPGTTTLKPLHEWPADCRAAVACIESLEIGELGVVKKIKLHSKTQALEMLMKYAGGFEKDNEQKAAKQLVLVGYGHTKKTERVPPEIGYGQDDGNGDDED